MKRDKLKNILAAIGAVVVIIFCLSLLIGLFSGSLGRGEKVAVVKLEGVITDTTELSKEFRDLEERDDIKAIVLRIDSPGGTVGPSQEIHSEILRLKKKKPVVASLGAIAASGGFYAAVAADKIVANPGTLTGSIGVIAEFITAEDLLSKLGVKGYVVKSGKYKDTGSPLRKMNEEELGVLQNVIDDVNGQFIKAVAEGRGLKADYVRKIADGRILSGAQAKEKGLIDKLGDLTDAIDLSAELAGIKGKPEVVYMEKRGLTVWKAIFGDTDAATRITELFSGLKIMYLTTNPAR